MDCKVYMLVPKDEFNYVVHRTKNKSRYKFAFTEMEECNCLTKEVYTYTDNKEYYLFNMSDEIEYVNTAWERFLCIYELFEQLSKYQVMVIKEDGSKYTEETGMPYSKGFEYPPLRCPIEKSFKYLEKVKEE